MSNKKQIDHHASIVIIKPDDNSPLIVLGGYDQGYPKWPGYANIIGGNHETGIDFTPWDILRREIIEETTVPEQKRELYAPEADVVAIRNTILENARPWKDFLVIDPATKGEMILTKPGRLRESIVSVYESLVSRESVEYMKQVLAGGKKFVSEGWASVTPIEKLVSGDVQLAWCSSVMMSHYLGKQLPNPHKAAATPIGSVKHSLTDYLPDFDYADPIVSSKNF